MSPISPALTASSSATAYNSTIDANPFDMSLDKMQDFSDLFDFEHFDSADSGSSSHGHSPKTISPNHTPSPLPMTGASPQAFSPSFDFLNPDPAFDFDLGFAPVEKAPPVQPEVVVKQEPVEFGFADPSMASSSSTTSTSPSNQVMDFAGLPADQQLALQELLSNMIKYQSQYGMDALAASPAVAQQPSVMPSTVQPALVFKPTSSQQSTSTSADISPVPAPAIMTEAIVSDAPAGSMDVEHEHDDEPLVSIDDQMQEQDQPVEKAESRSERQGSTFSSMNEDIESKLESLVPHATIFSAGRGKGGKKGGGMSSVVRAEDEDIDDDDSWRPSPEEYKKLSSKEKRQLRNKLSARAFRNRRKDYIGTLEGHIKDRDHVIDAIKSELVNSRSENQDLRRELAALKASTMAVLHPETANVKGESPAMMSALAQVPQFNQAPVPAPAPVRRAPTPKFNVRKDVPSSPAAFNIWNNNDPLGGGSTICHTTFTPDLTLPEQKASAPFRGFADLPRVNLNPNLNDTAARMPSLSARADERDLTASFSDWSENNAFSLRSMDSYRIQMWSRLAREAASEKSNVPSDIRPKFYVESAYAQVAQAHVSSKLASSFMSAFSVPGAGIDADKLAAVVTGRAKLKVVDAQEKDDADLLAAALGGLKLQSGLTRTERQGLRVRENPLAALGSLFKCPCPI